MLESVRKINVYYYTIFALIVTAVSGLFIAGVNTSFILQLIIVPIVTALADIMMKRIRFGKIMYSPSATITGLILAMVLPALPIYALVIIGLIAILQKHIIKIRDRHIFNPAAFGLLFAWITFGTPPAWWATATPAILLFLISDFLIKKLTLSVTFYLAYLILFSISNYLSSGLFAPTLLNYPLLFFATVMVVEPRTSAITRIGMLIEGILLGLGVFAIQQFLPIDVFIPMLLLMNLLVHLRVLK